MLVGEVPQPVAELLVKIVVFTEPPGRSSDVRRTAQTTSSKRSPSCWSAASETSIEISYGRAVVSSTWLMPSSAFTSSRTRSPSALSVFSSVSP